MALSKIQSGSLDSGKVLQIQSSVSTAASSINSTSYADIPNMTATITPTSTSSKILVQVSFGLIGSTGTSDGCLMKLLRGSTEIGQGVSADTHNVFMQHYTNSTILFEGATHLFVDSPSSTSALTYKIQWALTATNDTFYINRRGNDNFVRTSSTFLLTEISG
jgi:hypothetical protein